VWLRPHRRQWLFRYRNTVARQSMKQSVPSNLPGTIWKKLGMIFADINGKLWRRPTVRLSN
jgi:hypothetical protein